MRTARSQLLLFSATLLFAASTASCGLVSKDFEALVKYLAQIDGDDPGYSSVDGFDPSENEDVQANKDKIDRGQVVDIFIEITRVNQQPDNSECVSTPSLCAEFIVGQIDVRAAGATEWLMAVGRWDGIALTQGNKFKVDIPLETQKALNQIVFRDLGPIEIRTNGFADRGPVDFEFEVSVKLRFTASL